MCFGVKELSGKSFLLAVARQRKEPYTRGYTHCDSRFAATPSEAGLACFLLFDAQDPHYRKKEPASNKSFLVFA